MSAAIVGAGITGLTAAFYLQRQGIPVVIYEASERTGGMIDSQRREGFLSELGPNTVMTNCVEVPELVRDLGLEARRMLPSASATTRYIVRNGTPVKVPQSAQGAVATSLLSWSGKLRVLAEPFIGRAKNPDESLANFVRRRLGGEFLDYLIDPFVAGVYAGDPEQLSLVHALPKMAALEQNYGSLIKGAVLGAKERRERNAAIAGEPRMFSFDEGLRVLTDTLTSQLGGQIRRGCRVRQLERVAAGRWEVVSPAGRERHDAVLFCAPAHQLAGVTASAPMAAEMKCFEQVYYPPIARLALGFRRSQVAHPLDGFGALVPGKEKMSLLGVLFSSSMFENRAPQRHVLLTAYAGGARDARLMEETPGEIERRVLRDLRKLLGITGEPAFRDVVKLERSIPQYNVGYGAVKELAERIERQSPGLFLSGNFRAGISVSDCIAAGRAAAGKIAGYREGRVGAGVEVMHA